MTQEIPQPLYTPEVPANAVRVRISPDNVRLQFHPVLLNAIGNPDIHGPREYLGVEFRCPICQYIQPIGPPGVENTCGDGGVGVVGARGCGAKYKYTAVRGDSWLWFWKPEPPLVIETK